MAYLNRLYITSRHFQPGTFNAYVLGAALVIVATAVRVGLGTAVPGVQFISLFPAVIATTLICGMGAGFFTVVTGAVCAWYFILPPAFSFHLSNVQEVYALSSFVFVASAIVLSIGAMRTAIDRIRRLNDRLVALNHSLTTMFEANPDAILLTDRRGRIMQANQRAAGMFGSPGVALIGAPIDSLLPERFRERHHSHHAAFMAAPRAREMGSGLELLGMRSDGTEFPVDIQIGPIVIDGETLAIATVRDLTDHKALHKELAETRLQRAILEERQASSRALRIALEITTDGVVVLDHAWRFTYLNERAKSRSAQGRDLVGQVIWHVFPTLRESRTGQAWQRAMESGRPTHADDYFTENEAHFEAHAYPSDDGLTVFFRDVTAERAAVAALAESETRLRLFIDRAPAAIAMFDTEMRYLAASRRFALDYQISGGSPAELVGHSHYQLFPEIPERWRSIHRRVLAGETVSAEEDPFPRVDGRTDWVRWEMAPWRRADGAVGGAVLFSEIVTDRKKAELAVRDMTEDLAARLRENEDLVARLREEIGAREAAQNRAAHAERVQALGQLAGGMAHDFNNLLGVIILNLGMAQRFIPESDRVRKLVIDAHAAAKSGAELIRGLLGFARRQALRPSRVALNAQISGMLNLLSRVVPEDIEIVLEPAPDLWPVIADPSLVEACIMNLVTNARDAMPKGGKLTIATGNQSLDADYAARNPSMSPGDYAMIAVSDSGTGMAPEVQARAFEPFFTTKEAGKGTGLGLSMAFGFANQSGGHISIDSAPGEGTTIRMFLPRAPDLADAPSLPTTPGPMHPGREPDETVLVVEDNSSMREAVGRQLGLLNYRVVETDCARAALQVLENQTVDLVFSDVVMPGDMDGFALAAEVRERWPSVKVLLTSGFSGERVTGRYAEPEASVRLLPKPYDLAQLAAALREELPP